MACMIRVAPALAIVTLLPFALAAQPAGPTPKPSPAAAPTATARPAAAPSFDTSAWKQPTPPVHIVGPIHYVGTADLGVYLITTPAGHILLDGALAESAPQIEQSIRTLGFKPEDVKMLLISQAHFDHVALAGADQAADRCAAGGHEGRRHASRERRQDRLSVRQRRRGALRAGEGGSPAAGWRYRLARRRHADRAH